MKPEFLEVGYAPNGRPVVCPRCESDDIAFVTEYHKSLGGRFFEGILLLVIILMFTSSLPNLLAGKSDDSFGIIVILIFLYAIVRFVRHIIESRTHVECICKKCGRVWLHD